MIVEFDTVRSSVKESFEREKQADIGCEASIEFNREQDYKTQVAVDLDKVLDYTGGRVWYNSEELECVYLYYNEGVMSPNVLISYADFKKVFEIARGIKILRHEEL